MDADYPACPYPSLPAPIQVPLTVVPEHPCPYLPGRMAETRAFAAEDFPAELYHRLMDANFRRSGCIFYQPICRGCRACMQIRIPVGRFTPSKSQRRCWRRNQDLDVTAAVPRPTDEKFALYCKYLNQRHDGLMPDERASFEAFLYNSPVDTIEVCYRTNVGRLLAVGICDVCSSSLSSVYFYFDPAEAHRSLGTFGAMYEIDLTRHLGIPYYYLGYWIKECRTMQYKASFRPCQILHPDGLWHEQEDPQT
ncbi:MAG TPA: arginyltransferase [Tepidisphaeraceae bacterium]|nr:arginyltransferase [Tepidisphaeraceae bacterium]